MSRLFLCLFLFFAVAIVAGMSNTASVTNNPLILGLNELLPLFDEITPEHVEPALDEILFQSRAEVARLTALVSPDWDSLLAPLEAMDEKLQRIWGPVVHLNAVCDSESLRSVYQKSVARIAEWSSELAQNEALYEALKRVRARDDFAGLSEERRQVIDQMLRNFRLAGAELEGEAKQRFKANQMRSSELATTFEQHLLDATRAFDLLITDATDLAGIPESIRGCRPDRWHR